jgi:hypothetical protein
MRPLSGRCLPWQVAARGLSQQAAAQARGGGEPRPKPAPRPAPWQPAKTTLAMAYLCLACRRHRPWAQNRPDVPESTIDTQPSLSVSQAIAPSSPTTRTSGMQMRICRTANAAGSTARVRCPRPWPQAPGDAPCRLPSPPTCHTATTASGHCRRGGRGGQTVMPPTLPTRPHPEALLRRCSGAAQALLRRCSVPVQLLDGDHSARGDLVQANEDPVLELRVLWGWWRGISCTAGQRAATACRCTTGQRAARACSCKRRARLPALGDSAGGGQQAGSPARRWPRAPRPRR